MYIKQERGKIGEDLAVKYLENIGYKIIERNFYCRQGEIDIIAKDKNEMVFVEVKSRTNYNYGMPVDAVTTIKQKHIEKSTKYYLYKNKIENSFVRIDVIEVFLYKKSYKIHHIKQIM
jgi:putative endonuclease